LEKNAMDFNTYSLFCYVFFFADVLVLLKLFVSHRWLFIKPSMIVVSFFIIQIQMAATFEARFVYDILPSHGEFLLITYILPSILLLLAPFYRQKEFKGIFMTISSSWPNESRWDSGDSFVLLTYFVVLFLYLLEIPFMQTGLVAIFTDSEHSAIIREKSLKLVSNTMVRYSYLFLIKFLAPYCAVAMFLFIPRTVSITRKILLLLGISVVSVGAMLPGARSMLVMIVLTMALAFFLGRKMRIRLSKLILVMIIILGIPALMSIARQGEHVSLSGMLNMMIGPIVERMFITPMKTGVEHLLYVQTHGYFGVAGVRWLAPLFGEKYIDISNLIYQVYSPWKLDSGLSNTCYFYSIFSRWGLPSLPLIVLLTLSLDWMLLPIRFCNPHRQKIVVPVILVIAISFVSIDFTAGIVSGGFLTGILFILALDFLVVPLFRFSCGKDSAGLPCRIGS
jgi:hypothetical protein